MTAPVMSVIETMVLLNVAEMWAMPTKIFLLPLALTILGFSMSFGSSDRLVEIWSAGFTSAAGLAPAPFFSPAGLFLGLGLFGGRGRGGGSSSAGFGFGSGFLFRSGRGLFLGGGFGRRGGSTTGGGSGGFFLRRGLLSAAWFVRVRRREVRDVPLGSVRYRGMSAANIRSLPALASLLRCTPTVLRGPLRVRAFVPVR